MSKEQKPNLEIKNNGDKAVRYDSGKLRYDLIPTYAQQQYASVLTAGAKKYEERNWERGMKWSRCIGSLKRHIAAFESGEDFDPETGLLHMAHAMTNAAFLVEYYKTHQAGDDRPHWYRKDPKIGLDIDGVLADFDTHYKKRYNLTLDSPGYTIDAKIVERLEELKDDDEFWLTMPVKTQPSEFPFEPTCYITSRVCSQEICEQWLLNNGFPIAPVIVVGPHKSKVDVAKKYNLDWFIDDCLKNFRELNEAGICCFLFDVYYNRDYNVGHKRIKRIRDHPLFKSLVH